MIRKLLPFLAVVAIVLVLGSTAEAGYVFMKNGYIIQGRIVERDADRVVLVWPDGKMTIEARFIEEIITNAQEDEDIEALKKLQQEEALRTTYVVTNKKLTLPETVDEIVTIHSNSFSTGGGDDEPGLTVEPVGGNNTNDTAVDIVPERDAREYVQEGTHWAITPPSDWKVREQGQAVHFISPLSQTAAITVEVREDASVEWADARRILRETLTTQYPEVEIEDISEEQIGFERAFRLRGTDRDRGVSFVQVLVQREDTWYLLGMVQSTEAPSEIEDLMETALHSFRFTE